MELRNCARCKNLFISIGGRLICPTCIEEDEKAFELVKEFLDEYPKSTITQISEGTGVSEAKIIEYLKRGRLVLLETAIAYPCELCNRPIHTGRMCTECKNKLSAELKTILSKTKTANTSDQATKYMKDLREKRKER